MDVLKFYKTIKTVQRGNTTLFLGQKLSYGAYQVAMLEQKPKNSTIEFSPIYVRFEDALAQFDKILKTLKVDNVLPIRSIGKRRKL